MKKQTPLPAHSNRRVRANLARAATISAFGRHAWALDHADFVDRVPDARMRLASGAWVQK